MKAEGLKKIGRFSRYYIGVILGVMVFSILVEMFRKDGSFKVALDKVFFVVPSLPGRYLRFSLCYAYVMHYGDVGLWCGGLSSIRRCRIISIFTLLQICC